MVEQTRAKTVNRTEKLLLARAFGYPYERPAHSFLYRGGVAYQLIPNLERHCFDVQLPERIAPLTEFVDLRSRHAVLGYGSNGSPGRLQEKFGICADRAMIPVTMAQLSNFDVVYGAQITSYGAVPATLQHCPGVEAPVVVNWMTDDQLQIMHGTEGGYHYVELEGIRLMMADGEVVERCFAYISRYGVWKFQGSPLALKAIASGSRIFPESSQEEVLDLLRSLVGYGGSLGEFVLSQVGDQMQSLRTNRMAQMNAMSFGFQCRRV